MPDNFHPDAPRPAYFDDAKGAWVLSRYADVLAGLQHPQLWNVGAGQKIVRDSRDEAGRLKLRADVLARFSPARLTQWRPQAEEEARTILNALSCRTADLLSEFALPWGLSLAMFATGMCAEERERLGALSRRVFAATGEKDGSPVLEDAAIATKELESVFEKASVPMGEPTFVAFSQTLPRLLSNSWLALLRHPAEFARLRESPELMPGAVEELLRYGGVVRRVYRRSTAAVEIGGATIKEGDLVMLMLASANRDPEQFADPNRLDVTRSIATQVSLGSGRNSCVGAGPIRMALAVATAALVSMFKEARLENAGAWHVGSGFWFPSSINVTLLA
ncbi:MAG TPA: cytochrome P450 [Candidatus Limnocylindrales bacterium]|nr:cytochrome P450 [Candidatus Limnocylindrales bacterium]